MTDEILVSTITPCFRMQRYLKTFLERLPEQTLFDRLEVVLDHNDPTPEELEWVETFMARYPGRLRHIITSPVEPIGVSMNTCIQGARGKYLAIWNVDDLRTSDSLEAQVKALEATPEASVSCGEFRIVPSFGTTEGPTVDNSGCPAEEHERGMTIGPFFMFRANLCKKTGMFDEQLRSGADFDLALRLLRHGPIAFAEGCLGYYLDEGMGASTRPNSLQPVEANVIYLRYGIWDKVSLEWLPGAVKYDLPNIVLNGIPQPVRTLFAGYDEEMIHRCEQWFPILKRRYFLQSRLFCMGGVLSRARRGVRRLLERGRTTREDAL